MHLMRLAVEINGADMACAHAALVEIGRKRLNPSELLRAAVLINPSHFAPTRQGQTELQLSHR
jgi:hypothetical protein